jgi:transcriptional regulator with PAS, ATPase and Fis domain
VLLTGETGTGKDLAAKAIHYKSDRSARPFVNITCSALPEQLL